MKKAFSLGTGSLSVVVVAALSLTAPSVIQAYEIAGKSFTASIDTTVSAGVSSRVEERDLSLICTANGGSAFGCNNDDGNLNYDKGVFSSALKFVSDVEINHNKHNLGAFVRVRGFTDGEVGDTDRTPLPDRTSELVEEDLQLLDAYLWTEFDLDGKPLQLRFGKHVLNWGESTFIQGGINAINPVDVAAIRLPGAELREALLPVNMFSAAWQATENLSFEGFAQLDWEETIPDPSGSFFSINDFATGGGSKVQLGFGDFSDQGSVGNGIFGSRLGAAGVLADALVNVDLAAVGQTLTPDADFLGVIRTQDDEPADGGQWGISSRYFAENLNNTEFGFYYLNYHSRVPLISANSGTNAGLAAAGAAATAIATGNTAAGLAPHLGANTAAAVQGIVGAVVIDRFADSASYLIEYPEDIQLMGLSMNTNVGKWALQGEFSHKLDTPLQIDDVELLFAALSPLAVLNPAFANFSNNQVTNGVSATAGQYLQGYVEKDVSQIQATISKLFPNQMGADQFVIVAEAASTYVHDMPDKNTLRLNGPGTPTTGNNFHAGATGGHGGKAAEAAEHFPDAASWGYRLLTRWTFNNAFKAVTLQPRIAWQHDVSGVTPGPGGSFIEGRKALTLGLGGIYKQQWSADIGYTNFMGAGRYNLLNDRDFVSANIKYSF